MNPYRLVKVSATDIIFILGASQYNISSIKFISKAYQPQLSYKIILHKTHNIICWPYTLVDFFMKHSSAFLIKKLEIQSHHFHGF